MSAVPMELISKLRDMTGAGFLDCKKALTENGGDIEKAVAYLKSKSAKKIDAKLTERQAGEGIIISYVHPNQKVGAMLELTCETDFVARNDAFQDLGKHIAMHIAAVVPRYIKPEDVPVEVVDEERKRFTEEAAQGGKPADIVAKIVEGKVQKFLSDVCLLKQTSIREDDKTIEEIIREAIAKLGEKIEVRRFVYMNMEHMPSSCGV